jgi:hypothetical protein
MNDKTPPVYHLTYPDPAFGPFAYGDHRWLDRFASADWSREVDLEEVRCPMFPGHQRAGSRIGVLKVALPRRTSDFVWVRGFDCLISDKVLVLFRNAKLRGFDVAPVEVEERRQRLSSRVTPPTLWELLVTGSGGLADPASGIREIYRCGYCNLVKYSSYQNGMIVDPRQWDGSDFFTLTGYPKIYLVSERVTDVIAEHNLANCALIPAESMRWPPVVVRPEDIDYERPPDDAVREIKGKVAELWNERGHSYPPTKRNGNEGERTQLP